MATAVYAGSFDPVSSGHVAIIKSAAKMFDRVIVLIADNIEKKTLFTEAERLEMIEAVTADFENVEADAIDGIVALYAREKGAGFLVRGIRDTTDAEYEMKLTELNRMVASEIQTIFIPSEKKYSGVSSSSLKELAQKGEDISEYCAPIVHEKLLKKIDESK